MDDPARRIRGLRAFRAANPTAANRNPAAACRRSDNAAYRHSESAAAHGHRCADRHGCRHTAARNRNAAAHSHAGTNGNHHCGGRFKAENSPSHPPIRSTFVFARGS